MLVRAKAYKAQVGWIAKAAGVRKPIAGRVAVSFALYPKRPQDWRQRVKADPLAWDDTVQCLDLRQRAEGAFDALKGVAIIDVKLGQAHHQRTHGPDGEARVVVRIWSLPLCSPQASLL